MFFVEENDLKVLMFVMRCHEIWFGATMHNLNAKEWIDSAPNPLIDEETEAVVEDTEVMNDACATKPTVVHTNNYYDDHRSLGKDMDKTKHHFRNDLSRNKDVYDGLRRSMWIPKNTFSGSGLSSHGNGSEKAHFDDNLVENLHTANWGDLPGAHSIVCGGIGHMVESCLNKYKENVRLGETVTSIREDGPHICVATIDTNTEQKNSCSECTNKYRCKYVLLTVPISNYGKIDFDPPLPKAKREALARTDMTNYFKVFVVFNDVFWNPDITWIGNCDGGASLANPYLLFYNYYKYNKAPILVAFAYDTIGKELERMGNRELKPLSPVRPLSANEKATLEDNEATPAPVLIAIRTLERILQVSNVKAKVRSWKMTDWGMSSHSNGAYPLGIPSDFQCISEPMRFPGSSQSGACGIYFSGDGTSSKGDEGSLASAYNTGKTSMLDIIDAIRST
eukprot:g3373.t1